MYRLLEVRTVVADDSSLINKAFERSAVIWKTVDLESASPTLRVGTSDAEATVSLGSVSTGKFIAVYSDYPIRLRLNGASETQFTLNTGDVPVTNNGAPTPPKCFFGGNFDVTSLRVQPISGATQTANVWVVVTGDSISAYI